MPRIKGTDILNKREDLFDIEKYQDLFKDAEDDKIIGEVSSTYLYGRHALKRIKHYIPDAKLIVILRNPTERSYSDYYNSRPYCQKRSFEEGVNEGRFIREGFYYQYLKCYFEAFENKQIKVYLFDDYAKNEAKVLQDIFLFMGVDDAFVPETSIILRKGGRASKTKNFITKKIVRPLFVPLAKPFLSKQQRWRLSKKFNNLFIAKKPRLSQAMRKKLIQIYREDILNLQKLIQKDLSKWLQC